MSKDRDEQMDAEIRSAFRKQASRIASQLDVESSLQDVEGRDGSRGLPGFGGTSRLGGPTGVRGPLVALVGGFGVVVVLIGLVGLFASGLFSTSVTLVATETTLGIDPGEVTGESTPDTPPPTDWRDARYLVRSGSGPVEVLAAPGPGGERVAEMSASDTVTLTGEAATVSGTTYYEIETGGRTGWVDGSRLEPPVAWTSDLDAVPCGPDGSANDGGGEVLPAAPGASGSKAAGHVLETIALDMGDCDRIVIVLGEGAGVDERGRWAGVPASSVPEGVTVSAAGSVVSILVPNAEVRPLASTTDLGARFSIASRAAEGTMLRLFSDSAQIVGTQLLVDPARIVIDLRPDPGGADLELAALTGGEFVVLPIQTDPSGTGVDTPVTVFGWGRPNEATGVAELRHASDQAGSGPPVEATFSSAASGTQATSRYVFATTDWVLWGEFSLTIDALAPGDYELFIGEQTPSDGNPGVYLKFTVSG